MQKKKLIIIDDRVDFFQGFQYFNEYYGYFYLYLANNRSSFNKVKETKFDYCICDWRIPECVRGEEWDSYGDYYLDRVTAKNKYIYTTHRTNDLSEAGRKLAEYVKETGIKVLEKGISLYDYLHLIYEGRI